MENLNQEQQELFFKLSMFEQQIKQLQQQLQAIEESIADLGELDKGLEEIKEDKEILAPLGRGIFINAKVISKDLTVDVGGKNFVKKGIPETKKIIGEQTEKLKEIKVEVQDKIQELDKELTDIIIQAQKAETEE